jgi:outer membrane PBP1 activator LpoA protein
MKMKMTVDFELLRAQLNLRENTNRAAVLAYLAKHNGEKIRIDQLAKSALKSADAINSVTYAVEMLAKRIAAQKLSRKYSITWIDEGGNWFVEFSAK